MIVVSRSEQARLLGLAANYARAAERMASAESRLVRAMESVGCYPGEGLTLGKMTVWLDPSGDGRRLGYVFTTKTRVELEA